MFLSGNCQPTVKDPQYYFIFLVNVKAMEQSLNTARTNWGRFFGNGDRRFRF
jgi:hypothetical protein